MGIYILEFDPPFSHKGKPVRYYVGWSEWIDRRVKYHQQAQGAQMTRAAVKTKRKITLVYRDDSGTRVSENWFKRIYKNTPRFIELHKAGKTPNYPR